MAAPTYGYLVDTTEVFAYGSQLRLLEVATDNPSQDPTVVTPIPAATLLRLQKALQFGWQTLNNFLTNVYPITFAAGLVAAITADAPGQEVKTWNVRLASFHLARKRFSVEREMSIWRTIKEELKELQRADAEEILGAGLDRSAQVLPVGSGNVEPTLAQERTSIFDGIEGAPWNWADIQGERNSD